MKSARERAEEIGTLFEHADDDFRRMAVAEIEVAFKEHARDQRHACCEHLLMLQGTYAVFPDAAGYVLWPGEAHRAVMNTPAPGES